MPRGGNESDARDYRERHDSRLELGGAKYGTVAYERRALRDQRFRHGLHAVPAVAQVAGRHASAERGREIEADFWYTAAVW